MTLFGETTEEKKGKSVKKASAKKGFVVKESQLAEKLLSRPRITEKAYALNAFNQYVFVVTNKANKHAIKRAIEEVYSVNVKNVRIIRLPAKKRVFGKKRNVGSRGAVKKAIVSIAKGQSLELFKSGM